MATKQGNTSWEYPEDDDWLYHNEFKSFIKPGCVRLIHRREMDGTRAGNSWSLKFNTPGNLSEQGVWVLRESWGERIKNDFNWQQESIEESPHGSETTYKLVSPSLMPHCLPSFLQSTAPTAQGETKAPLVPLSESPGVPVIVTEATAIEDDGYHLDFRPNTPGGRELPIAQAVEVIERGGRKTKRKTKRRTKCRTKRRTKRKTKRRTKHKTGKPKKKRRRKTKRRRTSRHILYKN